MARGRTRQRPANPSQAPLLNAWPLDPPRDPTPAPGALRPGYRQFFCKGCRVGTVATDPPHGWIRVQVRDADQEARDGRSFTTTALLCSVPCLRTWAGTVKEVTV